MFSEADAFLDAIWAAPDDTPRLAYADWMEEHGHADYARFIRLSCQIARGVLTPPAPRAACVNAQRPRRRTSQKV